MAQASKTFRIFVSSTFSDLKAERNALQKHVFPKLREHCMQRGCWFQAIDLRWGVPDEQKAEGIVLPICLAEIHKCRSYFISLLDKHYGWVPDRSPMRPLNWDW
jgi:hypothetical protein